MATWLAARENEQGLWDFDPIGAFSRYEAMELALQEWPHLDEDEVIVIYQCSDRDIFNNLDELRAQLKKEKPNE